jgi:branched-chain amino acid transport system substrate-binding protein
LRRVQIVAARVTAAVAIGALVASACGSDNSGSSTASSASSAAAAVSSAVSAVSSAVSAASSVAAGASTTASGASSTAAAPTGSPLVVGVIGSFSGSQASSSSQGQTVAPAWEQWVNAQGGINGHPVKVELADDAGDPAKAQAAAKDLIDNKKAVALIVSSDNLLTAYSDYAISKNVPLVSGTANSTDWYTKAGTFPTPTDVVSGLNGQVAVAKKFGNAKKFANLYCSEVAACAQADGPLKAAADKAGIGYTSLPVSSTATSYTAECLNLQQQGVDYAQLNFTTAAAAKFVQDCQAQGYNPTWGSSEQAAGKDFATLPNFTMFGPAYAFPSAADGAPVKTFTDAMTKYAKGTEWKEGTASFTWGGLEMLRKALANVGASPTSQDVTAALNTVKDENLGGLLPNKVTYTQGKPITFGGLPCYFVVGMKGGKVTAPANLDAQCPTA